MHAEAERLREVSADQGCSKVGNEPFRYLSKDLQPCPPIRVVPRLETPQALSNRVDSNVSADQGCSKVGNAEGKLTLDDVLQCPPIRVVPRLETMVLRRGSLLRSCVRRSGLFQGWKLDTTTGSIYRYVRSVRRSGLFQGWKHRHLTRVSHQAWGVRRSGLFQGWKLGVGEL